MSTTAVIINRDNEKNIPGIIHSWHPTPEAAREIAKSIGGTTRSEFTICLHPDTYGSDPLFPSTDVCAKHVSNWESGKHIDANGNRS